MKIPGTKVRVSHVCEVLLAIGALVFIPALAESQTPAKGGKGAARVAYNGPYNYSALAGGPDLETAIAHGFDFSSMASQFASDSSANPLLQISPTPAAASKGIEALLIAEAAEPPATVALASMGVGFLAFVFCRRFVVAERFRLVPAERSKDAS